MTISNPVRFAVIEDSTGRCVHFFECRGNVERAQLKARRSAARRNRANVSLGLAERYSVAPIMPVRRSAAEVYAEAMARS